MTDLTMPSPPRHSARPLGDGRVAYGLWAPSASTVEIDLPGEDRQALDPVGDGWWQLIRRGAHGDRYAYHLDGGESLPDPASRWLPNGVHGHAAVVDPATFTWTDRGFRAAPVTAAVIYELHVGTFTDAGTLTAAIDHLDALVDLGITHVEVMPVNAFDGEHGWGYDGVAWWAVHQPYGGPAALAAFVDACHARGLAVILDVVHNHLGPSGNYLSRFGPYLNTGGRSTWGELINLDGPGSGPVRRFIIDSALAWLSDMHVDGLRLDAVHALHDSGSATHLLAELSAEVATLSEILGRPLQLIAETDRNDPQTVRPTVVGGMGLDAQWADDLHHAIHVAVTGEVDGWYVDFSDPTGALVAAYTGGFVYDGSRHSSFRGRAVGAALPDDVSSRRLVACIQNHDQIGNRAAGDRLTTLVDADLVRLAAALLCLAPHTPMLFMGEEWGETAPFQFFSDMPGEDLRQAIRDGRRKEFEGFSAWQGEVPDPLDHATFTRSKLDRAGADTDEGRQRWALWQDLLALRRTQPALANGRRDLVVAHGLHDGAGLQVVRRSPSTHPGTPDLLITANLTPLPLATAELPTLLSTADPRYGGPGLPAEGVVAPRSVSVQQLHPQETDHA